MEGKMAQKIIPINLGGVNCYLVDTGDGFILVDTGGSMMFGASSEKIRERLDAGLESAGCNPGNLKLILITHGDADHTGNAVYLHDKFKAPIGIHQADLSRVTIPGSLEDVRKIQFRPLLYKILFPIILMVYQSKIKAAIAHFVPLQVDLELDEKFDLQSYGFDARILHLPGHTPGSIGILTGEGDLIAGDILANIKKPDIAPNAFDFDLLQTSVDKLKKLDIKMVYPGHGDPFPMSQLLSTRP
jgi:hydroxyacylglutathione hydrolase